MTKLPFLESIERAQTTPVADHRQQESARFRHKIAAIDHSFAAIQGNSPYRRPNAGVS
tara:strand:+ start:13445 stop:13618 length:174 start_codon:yes stop_codon:yes gene_type:complete